MCGICGIINKKKKLDVNILKKINNKLLMRGPDGEGFFLKKNFGLAMKRLSIIGVKNGNQPISDKFGNQLFCNGEIYNYLELKKKYFNSSKFKTNSDCEVILHLYRKFGFECLKFLDGMFSFCIWDKKKNQFFIARDRYGMKPLYYYKTNECFVFSSTSRSIVKSIDYNFKIDEDQIINYFLYGYIPSPHSIWKNLKKLKPYHYITLDRNFKISIKSYKFFDKKKIFSKINFYDALQKNINIHTRSDVKIGSMLSAGVDSSLITALSSKNKKLSKVFVAKFVKKKDDESELAKYNSKKLNLITNLVSITPKKIKNNFENIINSLDEPISDTAIISTFLLTKEAKKKKIKVLLSGAGGDELFGGYKRYEQIKYKYHINLTSRFFVSFFCQIVKKLPSNKILRFLFKIFNLGSSYVTSISGNNIDQIIKNFYNIKTVTGAIIKVNNKFNNIFPANKFFLKTFDSNNYLVDNILSLTDQISMSNSVEVRVPFLGFQFNKDIFYKKPVEKNFLKEIILNKFGLKLTNKKTGFNTPISNLINDKFFKDKLKIKNKILDRLLNIDNFENFKNDQLLFSTIILNEWLKKNEF